MRFMTAGLLVLLAGLGVEVGCAALPRATIRGQAPLSESPAGIEIEGPRGPLPKSRAEEASRDLATVEPNSLLDDYLGMSARLIGEPLIIGNRVDLLVDGPQTYAAMFAAMASARESIDLETYIFDDVEQEGSMLSGLLADRVADGIAVRLLVDGIGSSSSEEMLKTLEASGVVVCIFNPISSSILEPDRLNHRDHRKIIVVDGDDSFAGGINFSKVYRKGSARWPGRGDPKLEEGWRDSHLRIRGPGARRLAELFSESWLKQKCPAGRAPVPRTVAKAGGTVIQIIPSSPDSDRNLTYLSVLGAVAFARHSISVTMAYFVPDDRLEAELMLAVKRGVQVRMIVPAYSDFVGVFYAGRAHYAGLLDAGVRIYEQKNALLHAKTVVIDGIWSTVGSTNWDWRSFDLNDEVSVVVIDEAFARRMEQVFADDLGQSEEITVAAWNDRPWTERVLEQFWVLFERLF